ncbi:hypothetical protein [Deinococcus sp. QL22]|uniref:hypothetical protein n=1 Tax=Deinococcus sp. QL22 TaxID=2939437 RepID=UPI002016F407|nr:hypothetical protein [Deinococcus sp. QL22]UQN05477.1 hypothetical protein M1R55_11385 [Deinococcus sp. QL22]
MLKYDMPVPIIRIENGKMYGYGSHFTWVEYPKGLLPDDAQALIRASQQAQLVLVTGPNFSVQGKVAVMSIGNGAKFRLIRSD